MGWETVWRGDSEPEAEIVAGRLRADGLEARVVGGPPPAATPTLSLTLNTWVVLAPTPHAATASSLLRQWGLEQPADDQFRVDWRAHLAGFSLVVAALAAAVFTLFVASGL